LIAFQASVEFAEDAAGASAPAEVQKRADLPLGDDELEAYLAADETPVVQHADENVAEFAAEDSSADESAADDHAEQQREGRSSKLSSQDHAEAATMQPYGEATDAAYSLEDPSSSHEEPLYPEQLQEVQSPVAAGAQQEPSAEVVLTAQPAKEPAHSPAQRPGTSVSSARTSTLSATTAAAGSSHNSSRHASAPGGPTGDLQDMWHAAGLPAAVLVPQEFSEGPVHAASDDEGFGPGTHNAFSIHASTGSISSLGGGPVQHRVKPRPASASPAVRRSCSSRDSDRAQEQQHSYSPGSNQVYQQQHQQQGLDVLPVASWTGRLLLAARRGKETWVYAPGVCTKAS
jgi:hypothetical protein